MNDMKGYIVAIGDVIWGSASSVSAACRDAKYWGMYDPEGEARCLPATGRLLAMITLSGGGVKWTLRDGVACYWDEVPEETNEEVRT